MFFATEALDVKSNFFFSLVNLFFLSKKLKESLGGGLFFEFVKTKSNISWRRIKNKNFRLILQPFFKRFHNHNQKLGEEPKNNKVTCWFFFSTKHVKNMLKSKSTQKTVAFSCFPQTSVLQRNRWKPYWMKLETVYFSKTISAEWQMLSRFPLYMRPKVWLVQGKN